MTDTFERLQTALHRREHLTGTVSFVKRLESGPVFGVCYEGSCIVIPVGALKLPEKLLGTDIDFVVMAIDPDTQMAVGCGTPPRGKRSASSGVVYTNRHPLFTRKFRNGKLAPRR